MSVLTKRHWRLQEFVAHSANVNCLSLGQKSGRVMVTGGDDRKVNLWAVGKPNCIMSLSGHTTAVECVRFDPREVMVCAGSMSGALKMWDLEAVKIIRTLTGHKANVRCLDFHPYGDFIASGSLDTNIKLWDARRKGCIYTYKGHSKAVNTLKFSPDGKWLASGGEDGSVKVSVTSVSIQRFSVTGSVDGKDNTGLCLPELWDLSAGKLLTEFVDHSALVSDIQFHPNEFLLASCSSDRTVKFWDLESFQLVSTTDGETLPIRCLCFHSSGTCLFSGSIDVLKVYGWEPSCTYDSIISGWGKVADMAIAQNQLIAGSFSMNSVSVHVVQLSTLNPLSKINNGSESFVTSPHITSSHIRKNFITDMPSRKINAIDMKTFDESNNPDDDVENDNLGFEDLTVVDPEAVFVPRSELCRTPPKSDPFPAPLDGIDIPSKPHHIKTIDHEFKQSSFEKSAFVPEIPEKLVPASSSSFKPPSPVKSTYSMNSTSAYSIGSPSRNFNQTYVMASPSVSICPPNVTTYTKISQMTGQSTTRFDYHHSLSSPPSKPMEKATALRRQIPYPPEAVSIVRPTMFIPEKETLPQRAVVYPEQLKSKIVVSDFVPQQRDKPAGLDVDEFLPKTLQSSLGMSDPYQPEMSEAEAMNIICRENQPILSVFNNRAQKLRIIVAVLKSKDIKTAIETAIHMNDQAILIDVLGNLNRRPTLWSLDLCQSLLPAIQDLVQSKYEVYMSTGCDALRLILKRFGSLIKSNVEASPSIGVDLCGEERASKCKSCYDQLLAIQSFILKRQTMQGELGQSFRELLKIMCSEFSSM